MKKWKKVGFIKIGETNRGSADYDGLNKICEVSRKSSSSNVSFENTIFFFTPPVYATGFMCEFIETVCIC
jgi:hypothetical protein